MTPQDLKRYNRRLADLRGKSPHGDPIYQWVHSRDLLYPCRIGASQYTSMRQVDEDRWVIAKWMPPPPEMLWKEQFPDIGYPANGQYYATDLMLAEGVEPNEGITEQVAGKLKAIEVRTFRDCLDEIERARAKNEEARKAVFNDYVDDACTAFGNLPGARGGHVSFGGSEFSDNSKPKG